MYKIFSKVLILVATISSLKAKVFLEHPVVHQPHQKAASNVAGNTKTACNGSGMKSTWQTHFLARKNTSRLENNCLVLTVITVVGCLNGGIH